MNKFFTIMRESSVARFLIPVGITLIAFGIVIFVINTKNQNYIKVDATIIDVQEEEEIVTDGDGKHTTTVYNVTLKYTVDGKSYTNTLDNVGKYNVGDKMEIYYNPSDPNQITQTKSLVLPIVIIAAGIASLTGGIVSAVNTIKKYKKMKEQERSWANE